MRFDLHLRAGVKQRIEDMASRMKEHESAPAISEEETAKLREALQPFVHATSRDRTLTIAGIDGTGEYPMLAYGDSFVHVTLAQATRYSADSTSGLKEISPTPPPVLEFTWLPEDDSVRREVFDEALTNLAGESIEGVIRDSDYRQLKREHAKRPGGVEHLLENLIRPHASDLGNLGIQLRSTGELGAALRLLRDERPPNIVLTDGTFSLPFVQRGSHSLFHEHLKRLCCVEARRKGVAFLALSKSHGLPAIETLEELARDRLGPDAGKTAEHWYLRIPRAESDGWILSIAEGRNLPPQGAVTYLVRFHKTTPVLRLDMDRMYWETLIRGDSDAETRQREILLFEDLDYACHDQRCYGYPYPIKAGHDRASLTKAERLALRKQVVETAVRAGMRRSLFRDAPTLTGHD